MAVAAIRGYERKDLPLDRRLPSLARRFPCLEGARGVDPWAPEEFHGWMTEMGEGTATFHAGLLILNLWQPGHWPRFDLLEAAQVWGESDRQTFINWMRVWRFSD